MPRLEAVVRKEFLHIRRDPRSLIIIFALPLMMIFLYGYAINYDLKRIDYAAIDWSQSGASRELLGRFGDNRYFVLHPLRPGAGESQVAAAERLLRAGVVKEYLVVPADFAERIANRRGAEVGLVLDGSDANACNLVYQYNQQILMQYLLDATGMQDLIRIRTHVYFNPENRSSFFFIPGLVAILLMMITALLTSISITREKETGSIDLLFISPLRSREIVVGKTIPYVAVAFAAGTFILLFAKFWFGIPLRGSLAALLGFSLIYVFCGLSFGILISTIAPTQRIATIAALLTTMLPSIMLSGFIFPLASMPLPLRLIAQIVPATYFLRIIRGVVVKGAGLGQFLAEGGMLLALGVLLVAAATRPFDRRRRRKA